MSTVPPSPYEPPQSPAQPPPPPPVDAAARVDPPAIALLVTAILGAIFAFLSLLANLGFLGLGTWTARGADEQIANYLSGGVGVASNIIGLVMAGIIIYAAQEMRKLNQWGLSVGASILAMIPCISPCCVIGLPVGIWSLVVLMDDRVRSAFHS